MIEQIRRKLEKLAVKLNRPLWPRQSPERLIEAWNAGQTMAVLAEKRPQLLVTLTTYSRPHEVSELIEALAHALEGAEQTTFVCVFNDASDADCSAARALLLEHFGANAAWLDARENFGKRGFWRTHQMIFHAAKVSDADHLLSLQDDIELVPDFLDRLWQVWYATGQADARRRVLYLFSGEDDEPEGRWHRFSRVDLPAARARRTDWFDLQAFLIDRAGLSLLRYWMVPISPLRWKKRPTISSGVGQQLTQRMAGRGTVYQCEPPLVSHGKAQSHMNPEARAMRPLDNRARLG